MRKPALAVAAAATLALALPASGFAATLTTTPAKECYGTGDTVSFAGTGFTPGGLVDFARDGRPVSGSPIPAQPDGTFEGDLDVLQPSGQALRTYTATDRQDPAILASTRIRVSELDVRMRPAGGRPAARRRIVAKGFTSGRVLWAHILFRRSLRNVRIGRLEGACGRLEKRMRLFPRGAPFGRRLIHYDTNRRYRRRGVAQRISFEFDIFPDPSEAGGTR
jgi:hypothetical protein